jgi:hypothetical protein
LLRGASFGLLIAGERAFDLGNLLDHRQGEVDKDPPFAPKFTPSGRLAAKPFAADFEPRAAGRTEYLSIL